MRGGRRGRVLTAVIVAAMLAVPAADARTRRPKTVMQAIVNGKRVKGSKRSIIALYAPSSFSINGASKPRRGLVRTVTANCGPVDIKAVALPITLGACFGSYTEAGPRRGGFRQWTGPGMEVTVESFDGTSITGRFRGTLVHATTPGDPPATVENGIFTMPLP